MNHTNIKDKPCKSVTLTVHSSDITRLKEKGADFSSSLSGKVLNLQDRILYQGIVIAVNQLEPDGPAEVTPETNVQIRTTEDHILLVCKSCGNARKEIRETCSNCGATISIINLDQKIEEKSQPEPQRPVSIEKKSNRNLFIAIGAVLVVLILAAVIFLFTQPKSSSLPGTKSKSMDSHINVMVKYKDKIFNESGFAVADPEFFNRSGFQVIQGRFLTVNDSDRYSIVITMEMAKKYFGDGFPPLGETLNLNNKVDFRIIGVVRIPGKINIRADFFITTKGYKAIGGNINAFK